MAVLFAVAAASPAAPAVGQTRPVAAAPADRDETSMYGEPSAAARHWREQHDSDCGEMAVADVVGQITGHQPTETQITALAANSPSTAGSGPIWKAPGTTDIRDLPVLLQHYGIDSDNVQTDLGGVMHALANGHKVIAIVNAETIWDKPGQRDVADHFVVVTGIDARSGVVHVNDSAVKNGRDEKIPLATFTQAWASNHRSAIVTR